MASKLCFLLVASSLAFLLIADATIIRTTVSEVEEENRPKFKQGSCSEMTMRGMNLRPCMDWMQVSAGSRYEMNPFGSSTDEYKEECCGMMSKMPNKCRCDALKEMMMKECRSPYSSQERMMCKPMMMEKMMNIPNMCNRDWEKCEYEMILV